MSSFLFRKRKERLVDGFAAADRALAGLLEALAFVEHKPALHTFGGPHDEASFGAMERRADMLQVIVHVLLGNANPAGELMGRQRPVLQFGTQIMADGIVRHRRRTQA